MSSNVKTKRAKMFKLKAIISISLAEYFAKSPAAQIEPTTCPKYTTLPREPYSDLLRLNSG